MTDPGPFRPVDLLNPDRRPAIYADRCVMPQGKCSGDGTATQFRDDLSQREYRISGLCQACQDSVFGVSPN